jgi:hypothetical protein
VRTKRGGGEGIKKCILRIIIKEMEKKTSCKRKLVTKFVERLATLG